MVKTRFEKKAYRNNGTRKILTFGRWSVISSQQRHTTAILIALNSKFKYNVKFN